MSNLPDKLDLVGKFPYFLCMYDILFCHTEHNHVTFLWTFFIALNNIMKLLIPACTWACTACLGHLFIKYFHLNVVGRQLG